jgi:hypothetical protein
MISRVFALLISNNDNYRLGVRHGKAAPSKVTTLYGAPTRELMKVSNPPN